MRIETKAKRVQEALEKELGAKVNVVEYRVVVEGEKAPLVWYKVSIGKDGWFQVERKEDMMEYTIRKTLEKLG